MIPAVAAVDAGSGPDARRYRLVVHAQPHAAIALRSSNVPGWITAFCTAKVCSTGHTTLIIPASGTAVLRLDVFRIDDSLSKTATLTIFAQNVPAVHLEATVP